MHVHDVEPAAGGGTKHNAVERFAELRIGGIVEPRRVGILHGEVDAGAAGREGVAREVGHGHGDPLQRAEHQLRRIAKVARQGLAGQLVRDRQRGKHRGQDRRRRTERGGQAGQMAQLASQRGRGDRQHADAPPVGGRADRGADDARHAALANGAVVGQDAPVLGAIEAVRHRLDEIHVERGGEADGLFDQRLRIEVGAGEMRPEGVGRAIDLGGCQGTADPFQLRQGQLRQGRRGGGAHATSPARRVAACK